MKPKTWPTTLVLAALLPGLLLVGCNDKGTGPEDGLNVSNNNQYCGLVAGFVKNSTGANLEGVTVCISPAPSARIQAAAESQSLSGFMNYPNPFTSDTYLTYFLGTETTQSVSISIYDLRHDLRQEFLDASTAQGPNKIYFNGQDLQDSVLVDGLYPCEITAVFSGDTTTVKIALSKGINIASEGGLQSYTVSTPSGGKYIIEDVPLNILLHNTIVVAPLHPISYPDNWPYSEATWELTDRFIVSASKQGYTAAVDTVTLTEGQVTRLDFTLQ